MMVEILSNDAKRHQQWIVVKRKHRLAKPIMLAGPYTVKERAKRKARFFREKWGL
jgi:hypothetical protein